MIATIESQEDAERHLAVRAPAEALEWYKCFLFIGWMVLMDLNAMTLLRRLIWRGRGGRTLRCGWLLLAGIALCGCGRSGGFAVNESFANGPGSSDETILVGREPVTLEVPVSREVRTALAGRLAVDSKQWGGKRYVLSVMAVLPKESDLIGVRVLVNVPQPDDGPIDDRWLSPKSPYRAGSFAFFPRDEKVRTSSFYIDLDPALRRLQRAGELQFDNSLRLTFLAIPRSDNVPLSDQKVQIEKVEFRIPASPDGDNEASNRRPQ